MTKKQQRSLSAFLIVVLLIVSFSYQLAQRFFSTPPPTTPPAGEPSPSVLPVLGSTDEDPPISGEVARVNRVIDGDTIELADGRKVRYIGIDTPETKHPRLGQECFGQQAKTKNAELVEGKEVKLEKDVSETDRYGRLLRYVWVDEVFINEALVKAGFAVASSYPPDIRYQSQLQEAEVFARERERGLWFACPSDP